ncbi:hypothetical protein [Serratia sp. DD3]|uniref:hypothetical protein n=1 Tax=Serratia sp. DD3 TaxID=1410619 RepID=UPI0003C52524|nr:hypothetical protein [Serratia sp. DD3]KEY57308.1 hypothetical protein SRDD_38010 [Serratia sp. DD3]
MFTCYHSLRKTYFTVSLLGIRKGICALIGSLLLLTAANAAKPNENLHFTFAVSDLYTPFFTPQENAAVLSSLSSKVDIIATYRHRVNSLKMFACITGVTCLLLPHREESYTETRKKLSVNKVPGKPGTVSIDLPKSLDGGYILEELYISLSADQFYRQPSYRALAEKLVLEKSPLDDNPTPPSFEFLVEFTKQDVSELPVEHQACLFVYTPTGFPDFRIPVVTQVSTGSTRVHLTGVMHQTCPLTNINASNTPGVIAGHLPPSRITAAKTDFDNEIINNIK